MKRNSMAVPAAPRSFEEIKVERSGASTSNSNNVSTANTASPTTEISSPWLYAAGSAGARAEGVPHRYCTGEEEEGVSSTHSLSTYADVSSPTPAHPIASDTATADRSGGGGGDGAAHEGRRRSNAPGIDLSKSPTTAALAAGARAAGAAQPFFFSLKLPTPPMMHAGAPRNAQLHSATVSLDNNSTCDSPYGSTTAATGERRADRPGGHTRTASTSSPRRLDDTTGTTPRILGAATTAPGEGHAKATVEPDTQQPSALFPRDVGPLPASRARAHNRLSSGKHIRRRPRSIANRRTTGTARLLDSTDNASYGSPTINIIDAAGAAVGGGGAAGRGAFAPSLAAPRPRGSGVATSGRGVGNGGRGTGLTRDVLPPGTRTGTAMPHRRRADPSPAPSRPPRARKGAAVIRAANNAPTPGTPALTVISTPSAPTNLLTSPTQLELARSRTNTYQQGVGEHSVVGPAVSASSISQQQQQHPMWSVVDSPGATTSLDNSLDARYLSTSDKDTAYAAAATTASSTGNNTLLAGSSPKSLSGRLISGSAARTHTPRASTTVQRGMEDNTLQRQDYSKLAEYYVQLCAAVGKPPNAEWISGLQSTESETSQQQQQHKRNSSSSAALTMERHPLEVDSSPRQDLAPVTTTKQTLTPGGGARLRGNGATAVTPRARTPAESRTKSPRGGAASSSTATAKRSGSVGRITTVNRASILASSQTHSGGAVHTPRTRGATSGRSGAATSALCVPPTPRETVADLYAQRVSCYCAEHLRPYVDKMGHIQQQRQTLGDALNAFVRLATSAIPPSTSSSNNTGGDAAQKFSTPSPVNPSRTSSSTSLGHRGRHGSGKGVPAASILAPSSLGTTPRKPSTASSAARAASLTDGLQGVQDAVIALLSSLADGMRLAHLLPTLPSEEALMPLISPPSPSPVASVAGKELPPLALHASAAGLSLPLASAVGSPPSRFLDFVETQEEEIAEQLSGVCDAVRTTLVMPASLVETTPTATVPTAGGFHGTLTLAAPAAGTVAGSSVQLEHADMLDNPLFVPSKYLQNLAAALAGNNTNASVDEDTATEANTPKVLSQSDMSSVTTGVKASTTAKSGKTAKKSKTAKISGVLGSSASGDTTGRSSTESTPRHRASVRTFAPLFTVRLSADDASPNDINNSETRRRSTSSSSTDNIIPTTMAAAGMSGSCMTETFVLHCIQPTAAAACPTPRQSIDSDVTSGRQNAVQHTESDPASSAAASPLMNTTSSAESACVRPAKRATSAGARKRRSGAERSSNASGASTRVGTAGATTAAAGGGRSSSASRTALAAPWLAPQGGRCNTTSAAAASASSSGKRTRKKSRAANSSGTRHTQDPRHQQTATQLEVQQQLVVAWKVWSMLEHHYVSSRKASGATRPSTPSVMAHNEESAGKEGESVAPQELPTWRDDTTTDRALRSELLFSDSTPPTAKASTAAATPANVVVEMPQLENDVHTSRRDEASPDTVQPVPCARDAAAAAGLSDPHMSDPDRQADDNVGFRDPAACSALKGVLPNGLPVPRRRLAMEEERRAARCIVDWWMRVREWRKMTAEVRATHAALTEQQRRCVMEARVRGFLLRGVCRLRLQRRIRARDAADTSGSFETRSNNMSVKSATAPSQSAAIPTVVSTSREKFLRSREQRKAIIAGAAVATASGASLTGKDRKDACAPYVPPLPLASSGISTYAMKEYESDSSFTVAAIHRLLHAPPSLLYATCTAALHYPTHPPMAYLDNTTRPKSTGTEEAERLQSEIPPDAEARLGGGRSSAHASRNSLHHGSPVRDASTEAQGTLWSRKGVCFVRFRDLRLHMCGEYEARIPPRTVPAAMDCTHVNSTATCTSSLDNTVNILAVSHRSGNRQQSNVTTLTLPCTMRYDSVVDANELHHRTPVTKTFHRPFEQWGMAHNLTARIFCAAAIYAWQLIFSHTPFDDAKQRDLPTREDRQARLERVAERNDIILDCYGVRSEREWMREATKDLSFVGQLYMPHYAGDDPAQERECMDNYDFVKNFLLQCFPNINKLREIPDFLVGAGILFVLKEVFHMSRDSPLTRRLQKYVPRMLVKDSEDYLRVVTPASSPLYAGVDDVGSNDDEDVQATPPSLSRPIAAPTSLVTPRATDYGKGDNGLSGLQRAVLHRYEQLRQLHHLSYGMLDEEERAACAWGGMPLSDKSTRIQSTAPASQQPRSSSGAAVKPVSVTAKDKAKGAAASPKDGRHTVPDKAASATSPMRRYMVHSGAGPVTPLRATPTTTALSSAFNTPAAMLDGSRRSSSSNGVSATAKPAAPSLSKGMLPPRESDIQLVHVPHRLLRPSVADAQFVREFEEEVSKSVHRIVDSVAGGNGDLSFNSTELPAALAEVDVHDALDVAYPEHFLVKLSEMLAFELFGLQVSLGSCEDLDSISS